MGLERLFEALEILLEAIEECGIIFGALGTLSITPCAIKNLKLVELGLNRPITQGVDLLGLEAGCASQPFIRGKDRGPPA